MAIIKNISRLSELKIFDRILSGMKTIVSAWTKDEDGDYTNKRQSYNINIEQIKGNKISDITEDVATESGGRNTITVKLDDGTRYPIYVWNGGQGNKGKTGDDGPEGDKGNPAVINPNRSANSLTIVNDNETEDATKAWSAYRGKVMYDEIKDLNETFVNESHYELLFDKDQIVWMYAEFTTTEDDQDVTIFNNDNNDHTVYVKYWTYEDSDVATYYVAIFDDEGHIVRYDPVSANLWTDIYLGGTSGYFEATANQKTDGTEIYIKDDTGEYKPIELVYATTTDGEGHEIPVLDGDGNPVYLGDKVFDYYDGKAEAYVHCNYSGTSKRYDFNVLATELVPDVYIISNATAGDDGEMVYEFEKIDVSEVDTTGMTSYYSKADINAIIEDIDFYIGTKPIRYFVKDNSTVSHTHNDVVSTSAWKEVEYNVDEEGNAIYDEVPSTIDTNHFQEYMVVTYDSLNNQLTLTRYYSVSYAKDTWYESKTSSYNDNTIKLYVNMEKREYYTAKLVETTDAEGHTVFENEYTLVKVPVWIYAEFTTSSEDEDVLIVNASKDLGEEDNTQPDETSEDDEEKEELVQITHLIFGEKPDVYHLNSRNEYVKFDLETETLSEGERYFTLDERQSYREVSGEDAISMTDTLVFYVKNENDEYVVNTAAVTTDGTYYIAYNTYTEIEDIRKFLYESDITLFYGEPNQVFLNVYPSTANYRKMELGYDDTKVEIYEDGRIAAIAENCETDITLTALDGSNASATLHVTLTTPMRTLTIVDENGISIASGRINKGETIDIYTQYSPETTSDTEIVFTTQNADIATISVEDGKATLNGVGTVLGKVNIVAQAHDGFGASDTYQLEVIQPAESIAFDQDSIENYHEDAILYTEDEAYEENSRHMNDGVYEEGYEEILPGDVKIPAVDEYRMVILMGIEYEIDPVIEPQDTSYPAITWTTGTRDITVTSFNKVTVIEEAEYRDATEDEIADQVEGLTEDNKILVKEAVTETHTAYKILGRVATNDFVQIVGQIRIGHPTDEPLEIHLKVRVDQAVERITVNPSAISFNVATNKKLTATIVPETAVNGAYKWRILDSSIVNFANIEAETGDDNSLVSVNATTQPAIIHAVKSGVTKVEAVATDGSGVVGTCDVTITIPAKDIFIEGENKNGIVYVGTGNTTNLEAVITYNEKTDDDKVLNVVWSSSDNNVATVNDSGTVTGVTNGKATIVASAADGSGVFGTIQVYVITLATAISFAQTAITIGVDESYALVPIFEPQDTSNEVVIWTSTDNEIATVNNSGIITALKPGTVTVTAATTDGSNLTASVNVTII